MRRAIWLAGLLALGACDDSSSGGAPADDLGATADGATDAAPPAPDAGGPCVDSTQCGGQVCVEGACLDCVTDPECAAHPEGGADGRCVDGLCCAAGAAGCLCGDGCGDDLACVDGRCADCPFGTPGCPCGEGCADDHVCRGDVCGECAFGSEGCPCADGGCDDALVCEGGVCARPRAATCEDLDCADRGRRCEPDPEPACAGCDVSRGYVEGPDGECRLAEGACADDAECGEGERCLHLVADAPPTCAPLPECVDLEPAGGEGQVWSRSEGACIACAPCADVVGSTGRLWPTATRDGRCVCETEPGWYFDLALAAGRPEPCDADADGWVRRTAADYLDSDERPLAVNARCAVDAITRVVLSNERGETREVPLGELGVVGERLRRFEPPLTDDADLIAADDDIALWGERKPAPAALNPLTKLCAAQNADFNANEVPDRLEHPFSDTQQAWMRPFMHLAHFAELHEARFADGTLTIQERPRCAADFPLRIEGEPRWRECIRRRPGDFDPRQPGGDLGAWACAALDGTCPPPSPLEVVEGGELDDASGRVSSARSDAQGVAVVETCSQPPRPEFGGMLHHSQFQCAQFLDGEAAGPGVLPREQAGVAFDVNLCAGGDDGVECAVRAPENGAVGFAAWRAVSPAEGYTRGCQAECPALKPLCPGYHQDDEQNDAGCEADAARHGALVCNRCPATGEPCDTGLEGACAAGVFRCLTGEGDEPERAVCVGAVEPDPARPDPFDADDQNCDGFDGVLAQAIFVDPAGDDDAPGTHDRPVRSLVGGLARVDGPRRTLYLTAGDVVVGAPPPGGSVAQLVVDERVELVGGLTREGCTGAAGWCRPDAAARARIAFASPVGLDVTAQVTLRNIDVESTSEAPTKVGVRVRAGGRLELVDSSVTTPDGADGDDADALREGANDGEDGARGRHGCREAAGFCAASCGGGANSAQLYREAGGGGDCACAGAGDACAGGEGGDGGRPQDGCLAGGANDVPAERGETAPGPRGGVGGTPSVLYCGGDNEPSVTERGSNGTPGQDGAAGAARAGTWSSGTGWTQRSGGAGARGQNGGGGGGGAGGTGVGNRVGGCPFRGGHGAGGGAGGCGGAGGRAGGGGGGSIAVLALAGQVRLVRSTLTAGRGGDGGIGAAGQPGGAGGLGGALDPDDPAELRGHRYSGEFQNEAQNGARGGDGGNGGAGGPGSGGGGGPAVGLLLGERARLENEDGAVRCGRRGLGGEGGPLGARGPDGPQTNPDDCTLQVDGLEDFVCEVDAHCPDGQLCQALRQRCVSPLPDGQPCGRPAECQSGRCSVERRCLPLGGPGDACLSDDECASGRCNVILFVGTCD